MTALKYISFSGTKIYCLQLEKSVAIFKQDQSFSERCGCVLVSLKMNKQGDDEDTHKYYSQRKPETEQEHTVCCTVDTAVEM